MKTTITLPEGKLEDSTDVIVHRKEQHLPEKKTLESFRIDTHPGYVIRGKANASSLNSASYGAGRALSRKRATKTIHPKDLQYMIEKAGIELIGGHVDEAPSVYKNIDKVMSYQKSLVEVLARFTPKIVRMAEPGHRKR
ncbi:MAG: RtcB family protein [Bacteroidales bacterium]